MNSDLPNRDDYYRPKRARELRRKASRAERSQGPRTAVGTILALLLGVPGALLAVAGMLGCLYALILGVLPPPYRGSSYTVTLLVSAVSLLGGAVLVGAAAGLDLWLARTARRVRSDREEADSLEAEHEARYGSLADEVP